MSGSGIQMKIVQAGFLIGMAAMIAGAGGASAQTREPAATIVAEQSTSAGKPSAAAKVRIWTRSRWEAARKRWARDNARFYDCSGKWREQAENRKYSLHDQREFLFQCMSDGKSAQPWKLPTGASVSTWTRTHWEAARLRWAQDHGKFYECRDRLLEQSRQRRFSAHDGRERLYRCMNEIS
jgi:hypothetical protein